MLNAIFSVEHFLCVFHGINKSAIMRTQNKNQGSKKKKHNGFYLWIKDKSLSIARLTTALKKAKIAYRGTF